MSTPAIARARASRSPREALTQLPWALLVAAIAAALTVGIAHLPTLKGLALVLVVLGSVWCASTRHTALALALVMLYLGTLDGFLKLATGSNYVTFVRDALLFAIAIGVLLKATVSHTRFRVPPLGGWVIGFVVIVLIQLANPNDGSLYHSLAGVRQHLEFVPLFFLTYAFVRTKRALRAFVILIAVVAAANGVANVVQFKLSPAQFAAWGPGYTQRILGTGAFQESGRAFYDSSGTTHTRPFGLMSDAGAGGLVDALALGAIIALLSIPGRRRYVGVAAVTGVVAIAGIVTSEGKAVIVCAVVVGLAYALLTATSRRGAATVLAGAALAAASYVAVTGIVDSSRAPVLRYQGLSAGNIVQTTSRARGKSLGLIPRTLGRWPLGDGLGTAGPATGTNGAPPQAGIHDAENEISFLTLETGIPGMALLIGFTVALCVLGFRRVRREPDAETRVLLAATVAPVVGLLVIYFGGAYTPTTPGGPYLWAAGGIVAYWLVARPAERRQAAQLPARADGPVPAPGRRPTVEPAGAIS
jgi:hypothetical protein